MSLSFCCVWYGIRRCLWSVACGTGNARGNRRPGGDCSSGDGTESGQGTSIVEATPDNAKEQGLSLFAIAQRTESSVHTQFPGL
jgi:hypothetical protein